MKKEQQQQQQQKNEEEKGKEEEEEEEREWSPIFYINTRTRILLLAICSPLLLPLIFLSLPLLCLSHIYTCLCHRRRRRRKKGDEDSDDEDEDQLRRCEEGRGGGERVEDGKEIVWMLLQRYLDDQLGLVRSVVSIYDCDGEEEEDDDQDDYDDDGFDYRRPLLR